MNLAQGEQATEDQLNRFFKTRREIELEKLILAYSAKNTH